MAKWNGLENEEKAKDVDVSSQTENIQTKSRKEIKDNFLKKFHKEMWDFLCKNSDLKIISEMPELQDITIDRVDITFNRFEIKISTSSIDNLFQVFLDNWFVDHNIEWVTDYNKSVLQYKNSEWLQVGISDPKIGSTFRITIRKKSENIEPENRISCE